MESGSISDAQITASSEFSISYIGHYPAEDSRLNTRTGWLAATDVTWQWLQIDLGVQYPTVTCVATQGSSAYSMWVTEYKLQFSINDGVTFHYYVGQEQVRDKVRSNKYKYLNRFI